MSKSERDYKTMAMLFNLAEAVYLDIEGEKHEGEVEELKIGEYVIYRLKNLTADIINLPLRMENISFKILNSVGTVKVFPTSILSKKPPRLMLAFPDREATKVARTTLRAHTNLKTPVFHVKSKNKLLPPDRFGLGTLTNISEGGCSLTLNMDIDKEDRIDFFLEVSSERVELVKPTIIDEKPAVESEKIAPEEKKTLELSGIIKSKVELSRGVYNLGIQFTGLDRETEKEISKYMKRRTVARKMARR